MDAIKNETLVKTNKLFYILTFFILACRPVFGVSKEGEELQTLGDLIASSERQLVVYKELHALIAQFQKEQDLFHEGEETKDLALQMVQTASKIQRFAKEHGLMHLFSSFFVEELNLFSTIAKKQNPLL